MGWRRPDSPGFPDGEPRYSAKGRVQVERRLDATRTDLRAALDVVGEKTSGGLNPWRSATANAPRLALLRLLRQCVRAEPVPGQPRLRRVVGELQARHRLWARLQKSASVRPARRGGIPRHRSSRELPPIPAGNRSLTHWCLRWLVWGVSHRDGAGKEFRYFRGRRG